MAKNHVYLNVPMKIQLALIFTLPILVACSSPEQVCLDSLRLELKDPDSAAVVANLGNRGLELKDGAFFLRYKAKNSYGAYISSTTYCPAGGPSLASSFEEIVVKLKVVNMCLLTSMKHQEANKKPPVEDCDAFALQEIYQGTGDLRAIERIAPDTTIRPNIP